LSGNHADDGGKCPDQPPDGPLHEAVSLPLTILADPRRRDHHVLLTPAGQAGSQ